MVPTDSSVDSLADALGALGARLRETLSPVRVRSVSLHDAEGDALWLSEGAMGPDEHGAVHHALERFAGRDLDALLTEDLGDGRLAVVLRAENAAAVLAGAALVVVESKTLALGVNDRRRFLAQEVQAVLTEFATKVRPVSFDAPARRAPRRPAATTASQRLAMLGLDQQRIAPSKTNRALTVDHDRLFAALRREVIVLHAQRLVPLRAARGLQRFEVLLRSPASADPDVAPTKMLRQAAEAGLASMIDRRVVAELLSWLVKHPAVPNAATFSVNLSATALRDEHFSKFVELCLAKSDLPCGTIGFEVSEQTCLANRSGFEQLVAVLYRLGSPVVLDDFSFQPPSIDLLRVRGVRMLKLSTALTRDVERDKVAKAAVAGVAQMARVLGMHTVAKRTGSLRNRQWLAAMGIDFVQSFAVARPVPLADLAASLLAPAERKKGDGAGNT